MFFIILLSFILMMVAMGVGKKTFMDKEKTSSFECGFDPYLMTRTPFSLRFYKIAIIFLIFDIEIILVLPLTLLNNLQGLSFFYSSIIVIFMILLGLFYEWHQGSLNWLT